MNPFNAITDFERYQRNREVSEGSIVTYVRAVRLMEKYLNENYHISLEGEGYKHIKGFMVSNWASSIMDLNIATRVLYLVSAREFLRFLFCMQYVDFDLSSALPPLPNIKKYRNLHPDTWNKKRNYTGDELQKMMKAASRNTFSGARSRALIAVLVATGLRVSELCTLNVGDVSQESGFAYVPRKGTHGNKVPVAIPGWLMEYVKDYLSQRRRLGLSCLPSDPLFVSNRGKRMDRYLVYHSLAEIQKKTGCPTGVHTYRHTALSEISRTTDPATSRDIAGQKSISVTNGYLHATDADKLAAVDSLSSLFHLNEQG